MDPVIKSGDVKVVAPVTDAFHDILTPGALEFIAELSAVVEEGRRNALKQRQKVQLEIDGGVLPDFPRETSDIRSLDWKIRGIPEDLRDRRVEITGPVDRKMVINALNSGAITFMADFEDSHSPTWEGTIEGQINLLDAVKGNISFTGEGGKKYLLGDDIATLIVRPRGWHLVEKHVLVKGEPVSASVFDFALFFYHNAGALLGKGSGPYFYLPKLESYMEARLWNDIFVKAQDLMDLPQGSIKATVLIETLPAAFQMDEILYELKEHIVGLNCGRWDYIFSFIKRFWNVPGYIFPDRAQITMTSHCMRSYSLLAIKTCHRRGAMAIGGMAAQIPIKNDDKANAASMEKVKEDKIREAGDGHDGTWVAHPGLVSLAREQFDRLMPEPNQINRLREDVNITREDLLKLPEGIITEQGVRVNIRVGVQYMASWLSGKGCVPLYNLMEDAATAEISRTQLWQWLHHPDGVLADGRQLTEHLFDKIMRQEMDLLREKVGDDIFVSGNYLKAAGILDESIKASEMEDFLTTRLYDYLE